MDAEHLIVLCTCPDTTVADRIASNVVAEGKAACANILPGLTSIYHWQGEVHRDPEALLIIKTTAAAYPALEDAIRAQHPYELPEVIAVPIEKGLGGYLAWVSQQTQPKNP